MWSSSASQNTLPARTLDVVSVEDLDHFIVTLKKGGMSPSTLLDNVIIIAQLCKMNGRSGTTGRCARPKPKSRPPC